MITPFKILSKLILGVSAFPITCSGKYGIWIKPDFFTPYFFFRLNIYHHRKHDYIQRFLLCFEIEEGYYFLKFILNCLLLVMLENKHFLHLQKYFHQ